MAENQTCRYRQAGVEHDGVVLEFPTTRLARLTQLAGS